MNTTYLNNNAARIEIRCKVGVGDFRIWVDTGAPNTLVPSDLANRLKLPPNKGRTYGGAVAGVRFEQRPSFTIPELIIPGYPPLRNVRAITALEGDKWKDIIVLGLNVLNHLVYKIDRDPIPGSFCWLESLTSEVPGSARTRFDHVIWEGTYLLADSDETKPD